MGTKLLLLYVICQTIITDSLGGVTLPFTEFTAKVTPIKPKPLSAATISSLTSSSSLVCDNKNKLPSPASGTREFSSPLVFTSTSRALPVPKINSSSIADVKIPERLKEKFVLPKLCCTSIGKTKPALSTPEVTLPYKYPFLSSSSKPSNDLPSHSLNSNSLNKISSLSSIKPSSTIPAKSLKSIPTNSLCSTSQSSIVTVPSAITLPRSISFDSTPTLEARTPSLPEQFSSSTFCPSSSSCIPPYPIPYQPTYLPGVRTPFEMPPLIFRPISYKGGRNSNYPSESSSSNLLAPKTLLSETNINTICNGNDPYFSPYTNPFKFAEIPKSFDPIQLPTSSSNVPLNKNVLSVPEQGFSKNLRSNLEVNTDSATVTFESRLKEPECTIGLSAQSDPKPSLNSKPYSWADEVPDFQQKRCTLPEMNPPVLQPPLNFKNSPIPPLVPISPSSPIIDVLTNKITSFDCSNAIGGVDIMPIIGSYVETIERLDTNDLSAYQTFVDYQNVPSLELISNPFAPNLASYQNPLLTQKCIPNPLNSPHVIPCEPIPTISSETPYFPPTTYFPTTISQTPSSISYINQFSPSICQTTSNIVSSMNDAVSSIIQNILSSCGSYIDSASPNIHQRPSYTTQSSPYDNFDFISTQTSPVNIRSIESITNSAFSDCIHPPTIDIRTPIDISSLDAACYSPEYEMSASQSSPICIPQSTVTVVPSTPLVTCSSPQLCPSYLSSPILPSCPTISSPFYMETPVFKVSSSKIDSDTEKLIELMVLAKVLCNDETFDWDDLDTLLAFLSLS